MKIKNYFQILAMTLVVCGISFSAESGASQKEKYVYESPLNVGFDIQVYKPKYRNYNWGGNTPEKDGFGINLGLEWIPLVSRAGKFATSLGFGFSSISDAAVGTSTATLYVVPIYAGVTYRADFFKNQVIVPFASGGLDFGFSTQASKNGATQAGLRTYEGWYYTTGVELCLNTFDPFSARELDSRSGINGVYLVAMYMQSEPLRKAESVNLSHKEFRLGIRFEI